MLHLVIWIGAFQLFGRVGVKLSNVLAWAVVNLDRPTRLVDPLGGFYGTAE